MMHGSFGGIGDVADKPVRCSASDYDGLRALINARRVELRMRLLDLDHDAGLQSGYSGKIFCGMRNFGPLTLGPILAALDVELTLIPRSVGTETKTHENVLQFANITRLTCPLWGAESAGLERPTQMEQILSESREGAMGEGSQERKTCGAVS